MNRFGSRIIISSVIDPTIITEVVEISLPTLSEEDYSFIDDVRPGKPNRKIVWMPQDIANHSNAVRSFKPEIVIWLKPAMREYGPDWFLRKREGALVGADFVCIINDLCVFYYRGSHLLYVSAQRLLLSDHESFFRAGRLHRKF